MKRRSQSLIYAAILLAIAAYSCVGRRSVENAAADNRTAKGQTTGSRSGSSASDGSTDSGQWIDVALPASVKSEMKGYTGFLLSFNSDNHTPNWVGWELLSGETDGSVARAKKFWTDTEMSGAPDDSDYRRSGYDRGHMCPAADQKWSTSAMYDSFVTTNICPQDHKLNTGAWKTLENKERLWAQRDGKLLIIAGPIYGESDIQRIGATGVRVPGAFFKVLVAPDVEKPRGIAFVYPNSHAPGNMQNYSMSIDELEELTGYDFFPSMPDDLENEIESTASFKTWEYNR